MQRNARKMKRRHERREKWKVHFSDVHPCLYLSFIHCMDENRSLVYIVHPIAWMKIVHFWMDICLYHFGLNYCSMSFITWMERLHLDEHLSISYVTWMKMFHHGWIICWYHWSHGWEHLDWIIIHHMDENVALGYTCFKYHSSHLDAIVSLRWTFCFYHSSQG